MPRELNPQQQGFIDALMGEAQGDFVKAKKLAGYAPSVNMSQIINGMREEIIEAASNLLVMNAPKASLGMVGILDSPDALGARNKINAASQILDRVGIVKKEQIEIKTDGPSIFILPQVKDEPE